MSDVMLEFLQGRLDRLSKSLSRFRVLLALSGGLILVLGARSWIQFQELNRADQESFALQAALDSLREAHRVTEARLVRQADHVAMLEGRLDRAPRGFRHAELIAVRAWIRRLEARIDGNGEHLGVLEHRLLEEITGVHDSSRASRSHIEATVAERLAAAEQARAELARGHSARARSRRPVAADQQ